MKKIAILSFSICILSFIHSTISAQQVSLFSDTYPGSNSGDFSKPILFNNKLYFISTDGVSGFNLWFLDGNTINSLPPKPNFSFGEQPVVLNNKIYCPGYDGEYGWWVTDGASSLALANYGKIPSPSGFNVPSVAFHGKLYYKQNDVAHGTELWTYDGVNPPELFYDINVGPGDSDPYEFFVFNDILFFAANDGINGKELWAYNGLTVPYMVKDITAGSDGSSPSNFVEYNNSLYFSAYGETDNCQLWTYDGTNVPIKVSNINNGTSNPNVGQKTVSNNKIFFSATTPAEGYELWQYDGTSATLVKDAAPGSQSCFSGNPFAYHNKVLYAGYDGSAAIQGSELWMYDGISDPISFDINPGSNSSYVWDGIVYQDKLFFRANDGTHGYEMWMYDDAISTANESTHDEQSLLLVYPNPSNSAFTIKGKSEAQYSITDAMGKEVSVVQLTVENNYTAVVRELREGLYTLNGLSNNEVVSKKIVIIK